MAYSPCLLIPIYNHWQTIHATVERLSEYGLPIFIIDDGSNLTTQSALADIAEKFPLTKIYRLPTNCGKGAAVMRGMEEALEAGFTHALQIDADGQHDTGDVPRFLEAGKKNPEAVVCGKPIYDLSVPKGRLYGRYLTHFWVYIETLGSLVADTMCGFRLYPLAATCALMRRVRIPARMDFDIEIAVRLAWKGVPFESLPTKVIYPPGGISHFHMWKDNARITWMHTRLFFSMLSRFPLLLFQKYLTRRKTSPHWARLSERGSIWGLRFILKSYRFLGKRAARLVLYPVVGYFFLTGRQARRASLNYLRQINIYTQKHPPNPRWMDSFKHMLTFGRAGLDKMSAWMGDIDKMPIEFPNPKEYEALMLSGQGALLIGSHLGNLELARALAIYNQHAKVNAVIYTAHAQRFNSILQELNADFGVNLIQVSNFGPETAIQFKEKVDNGEFVVIVGDRTPPLNEASERVSRTHFLGKTAPFAQGPFILASLLDCPVYLFFCLNEDNRYRIYMEHFADRIELPRERRIENLNAYIQRYASRLEYHCLKAPMQWFNFYDFWQERQRQQEASVDQADRFNRH